MMTQSKFPRCLSATTLCGVPVRNRAGEDLGDTKELMIDIHEGRIVYAVLSFGGFLGIGDKLFAVPWSALRVDTENQCFVLDVDKEVLEKVPGFDKDQWPDFPDPRFQVDPQLRRHPNS